MTRDAQWQVPYVGNEPGEPCYEKYYNDDIPPTCNGVWRWNLDQEVDRNENVTDYSYNRETNYFCLPSCTHEVYEMLPYDRGGVLASVNWGHNSQIAGSTPTARTTFTTAARNGEDVPTDLQCEQAAGCENDAIAFFSGRKLVSVLAESKNPTSGAWDPVERMNLAQTWIYQRTDFGLPYDPVMWLDTVRTTGLAKTPAITLPSLDFDAVMPAGRMDYNTMSDWTDLLSWRMVPRIAGIGNGMGGRIEVIYGQADPCGGGKGRDGTNYLPDQTNTHPFWIPELKRWVPAGELKAGQWLQAGAGTYVEVGALTKWSATQRVHNLTVADLHTYQVIAGGTPVLVHNCDSEIYWDDENAAMSPAAQAYDAGALGSRAGKAPALQFYKVGGSKLARVKFDGHDSANGVMIDRKLNVTGYPKTKRQAQNQSLALEQDGLTGVWEVPNAAVAKQARRILAQRKITNITVRIVPP
ncbi:polymorphic toxin-type HINT domain-containing protein [Nonomuraea sp. ZG12]|uniref:polymorphic toxin-type HINT domain-containing protein n=1 Tax=Nonomuraea sp. ZG12 TaxID=3452207 RepID=UPI003F8CE05F